MNGLTISFSFLRFLSSKILYQFLALCLEIAKIQFRQEVRIIYTSISVSPSEIWLSGFLRSVRDPETEFIILSIKRAPIYTNLYIFSEPVPRQFIVSTI